MIKTNKSHEDIIKERMETLDSMYEMWKEDGTKPEDVALQEGWSFRGDIDFMYGMNRYGYTIGMCTLDEWAKVNRQITRFLGDMEDKYGFEY